MYDFRWSKGRHVRLSARSLDERHSLFFDCAPWTPPVDNMQGLVSYYEPERIARVRKRLAGTDRRAYLVDIVTRILATAHTDKERVARICGFVSEALYYNPIQQPQEAHTGDMLTDPVELLELHDGRCGQGVEVTLALLGSAGFEARRRGVFHHVTCEARYDGRWHLADALMFGARQPERDGVVLNVAQLRREPYFADACPLRCFAYTPEELLSSDGYRMLGYCFGEWGALPYYSWYMGGIEDYPPSLPFVLPPERISDAEVRLRWSPSLKRNGGTVRYEVAVYEDRARTRPLFRRVTRAVSMRWKPPHRNRMYFIGVTAKDDHVRLNPRTWYPEAAGNFVLAPQGRYGWYGVL